jgi:secretion system chaperone SscA
MEEEIKRDEDTLMTDSARILVKEVMAQLIANSELEIPEAEKGKYEELMMQIIMHNKSPMEAMGFDKEMIEHMYAYGYRLYNHGNYKKAREVFSGLMILQPDDARFYLGQAACYQRLEDWEKAAAAYNTSSALDQKSPMPLFYMFECLNQLKRYDEGAECLKEAIKRCGNEQLFETIKKRCQLLLKNLPKEKKGEEEKSESLSLENRS